MGNVISSKELATAYSFLGKINLAIESRIFTEEELFSCPDFQTVISAISKENSKRFAPLIPAIGQALMRNLISKDALIAGLRPSIMTIRKRKIGK